MANNDLFPGAEKWKVHVADRKKEEEEKEARIKARKDKVEADAAAKENSLTEAAKIEIKSKSPPKAKANSSKTEGKVDDKVDPSRIGEPGPVGNKTRRWVKNLRAENQARVEGASEEFFADLDGESEEKGGGGSKATEDETTDDEEL